MPDPLTFAAPVLRGTDGMHYVPLPVEAVEAFRGVRRVIAVLNEHETRRAILSRASGERFLAVGLPVLRAAGLAEGETVVVTLAVDPEPDRIDLGPLADVLAADDAARERFEAMTPGRRRSLAYYVTSAVRPETQRSRAEEMARKLATGTLYGDLHPPRRGGE